MYVFENLDIYKNAVKLAAIVEYAAESFPASTEYFGDRLLKQVMTIPSHIAEAHGHWKDEERREFYWKAREATQECSGLTDIAARQGLIDDHLKQVIHLRLDGLQRMIQDVIRKTEKKTEPPPPQLIGPNGLKVV